MKEYTAIVSHSAEKFASRLQEEFEVLFLPPDKKLDTPVSSHADMNVFILGRKTVISRAYGEENPWLIERLRENCALDVILSDGERGGKYPYDIMLNVLVCDKVCFSLKKYTCREIIELIDENNMRHINVKQGYAACSSLAFGKYIVTSDTGIHKAAESAGIESLLISSGAITLEGYSEGFIGGASGVCGNKIYFAGDVLTHPDGEKILRFIEKGGFEAVSLSEDGLTDVGGIKFLKNITSLI
ncbi:MAG: hypothetical protein IKM46_08730 [Clostridia bacterium]|nr:hypothetical protein [Clostridia bacterium]